MSSIRERAEAPVHEITMAAILGALEKYPRRKAVWKEFCHEYKIADYDELTEALALEVLELIDDKTYIHTIRAKQKFEAEQEHLRLVEAMDNYLERNAKDFILLSKVDDCWLVAKRVTLIVYNRNDNSAFQPYETNETKEYFIVVAIKIADEFVPDEIIGKFITRGCKMIRVYEEHDIYGKLESIK